MSSEIVESRELIDKRAALITELINLVEYINNKLRFHPNYDSIPQYVSVMEIFKNFAKNIASNIQYFNLIHYESKIDEYRNNIEQFKNRLSSISNYSIDLYNRGEAFQNIVKVSTDLKYFFENILITSLLCKLYKEDLFNKINTVTDIYNKTVNLLDQINHAISIKNEIDNKVNIINENLDKSNRLLQESYVSAKKKTISNLIEYIDRIIDNQEKDKFKWMSGIIITILVYFVSLIFLFILQEPFMNNIPYIIYILMPKAGLTIIALLILMLFIRNYRASLNMIYKNTQRRMIAQSFDVFVELTDGKDKQSIIVFDRLVSELVKNYNPGVLPENGETENIPFSNIVQNIEGMDKG